MAIVNAVIDERKTRPVKRSTKKETFFSNNTSALTIELDTRANNIPERITEPLDIRVAHLDRDRGVDIGRPVDIDVAADLPAHVAARHRGSRRHAELER